MSKNNIGPCPLCPKGTADQRLFGPIVVMINKTPTEARVCSHHLKNPTDDHSAEKIVRVKRVQEELNLSDWYKQQIIIRPEFCEEPGCGKRLNARPDMLHFFICHILPKGLFPSVATHPLNRWFGCADHHTQYDRGWSEAQKMGVWDLCVERYMQFMQSIRVGEHRHLPDSLRAILDDSLNNPSQGIIIIV